MPKWNCGCKVCIAKQNSTARILMRNCGGPESEHPKFTVNEWHTQIIINKVRAGYWRWVVDMLENEGD